MKCIMFYNMISLNICGLKKETTTYNKVKSIYFLCPIAFYFFEFAKPMFQFGLYPIYVIFLGRLTSGKGTTSIEFESVTNSMWKVRVSVHIHVALSKLEIQMCVVFKS